MGTRSGRHWTGWTPGRIDRALAPACFGGGTAALDKPYYVSVVAEDANKKAITPYHSLVTTVTGVDLSFGEPALTTDAGIFAYADLIRLMRQ